jgi:hydrogenase expression/formation protein HypD
MKFIDEYRDPLLAGKLLERIARLALSAGRQMTIMEVCGTHTVAIGRFGIRNLLPENIRLISGPGCPVCVTSIHDVDSALFLAGIPGVIFATFGDMLRVPGSQGLTLQRMKARGADIRVIPSAVDCIELAEENMTKEVVLMGIGFETTSPTVASVVRDCKEKGIKNFSVFSVHKVIPPALKVLVDDSALNIDGFLCPGHVSTIIGAEPYTFVAEAGSAAVITGFEPVDILEGIFMILGQIKEHKKTVAIQYRRGVNPEGNPRAKELLNDVFKPAATSWRGLGMIPDSGLYFREAYRNFDARLRFDIPPLESVEVTGCRCGDILRGILSPRECPLFKSVCTPLNPLGPCMVSTEGTCSAYYRYH